MNKSVLQQTLKTGIKILATLVLLAGLSTILKAHTPSRATVSAQPGSSQLERFSIIAPQLQITQREIYVYLPPDYAVTTKSYPVIYIHDGSMLFSTNGGHDVRFDEILNNLYQHGETEGIIAVGIASSENRWDEYSPWVNDNMDLWVGSTPGVPKGGEGDAYLDFIVNTLKPEIDSRYRTLPDQEHTAIGGFSMGGLISIYAGLEYPNVFSKVLAHSPAVWFAEADRAWRSNNYLIKLIEQGNAPQEVKFYLDIGTNEWADKALPLTDAQGQPYTYPFIWLDGTEAVYDALKTYGVPSSNLLLVVDEGGEHVPAAWNARFADAVMWLWSKQEIDETTSVVTAIPPTPTAAAAAASPSPIAAHTPGTEPEEQLSEKVSTAEKGVLYAIGALVILSSGLIFQKLARDYARKNPKQ